MNREIKFKAWDKHNKRMIEHEWLDVCIKNINNTGRYSNGHIYLQWSGAKDKNKKDIYEGDICKGQYGVFVVRFEYFGFQPLCGDIEAESDYSIIEVIGNIYENPSMI